MAFSCVITRETCFHWARTYVPCSMAWHDRSCALYTHYLTVRIDFPSQPIYVLSGYIRTELLVQGRHERILGTCFYPVSIESEASGRMNEIGGNHGHRRHVLQINNPFCESCICAASAYGVLTTSTHVRVAASRLQRCNAAMSNDGNTAATNLHMSG